MSLLISSMAACIARPARTARSGSSSWATGAPNTAITLSPMYLSTRAAVAHHLLAEALEGPVDERLHRLRIHALGNRRVAGEIGEQHRRLAALLGKGARGERAPGRRALGTCPPNSPPRAGARGWGADGLGGAGRGGGGAAAAGPWPRARPALDAELRAGRALDAAARTPRRQLGATGHAEASPLGVLGAAAGTDPSAHVRNDTYSRGVGYVRSVTLGASVPATSSRGDASSLELADDVLEPCLGRRRCARRRSRRSAPGSSWPPRPARPRR